MAPRTHVVPLVLGRERRVNAGSRMANLLAEEAEVDELFAEEANDAEFEVKREERDIFDSDFGNTSSGSSDDESEDEEGAVAAEERAERKAARRGRVLPTALGSLKGPRGRPSDKAEAGKSSKRRRLSPGGTSFIGGGSLGERASGRTSTQAFKQSIDDRLEAEEARRLEQVGRLRAKQSTVPRRRSITQAELIAEALETEESNQASLLAFYAAEEEKRDTQAHSGRSHRTVGPTLSFISRAMEPLIQDMGREAGTLRTLASAAPQLSNKPYARNYVALRDMDTSSFHVNGAVLGYHADWTRMAKPMSRRALCAITGRPAHYKDAMTGAPFASLAAYAVLRRLPDHDFIFSDALHCFTGVPMHRLDP